MNETNVIVRRPSASDTLKRMEKGQTLLISERSIRYTVLYTTAKRLAQKTDMRFTVSINGVIGGTRVTRHA